MIRVAREDVQGIRVIKALSKNDYEKIPENIMNNIKLSGDSSYSWEYDNSKNFENALEVYITKHPEIIDNVNNNVKGAVISLELLKEENDESIKEDFSTSNISHVLAVSGMHISYIIFYHNFNKFYYF